MEPTISAARVRRLVVHHFSHHGVEIQRRQDLEERVHSEDGRQVAHCFRAGGLFAMWMVDIGLLQLYDQAGNMLDTLNLLPPRHATAKPPENGSGRRCSRHLLLPGFTQSHAAVVQFVTRDRPGRDWPGDA